MPSVSQILSKLRENKICRSRIIRDVFQFTLSFNSRKIFNPIIAFPKLKLPLANWNQTDLRNPSLSFYNKIKQPDLYDLDEKVT